MNDTITERTPDERMPDRKIWERLLYMLFCAVAYNVAELLIALVAIFQFLCVLVNGTVHERAQRFGRNLGTYAFQVFQFVTFNDERLPFPFSDWPDEPAGDSPWRRTEPAARAAQPAADSTREDGASPTDAPPAPERRTPGDQDGA